MKELENGLFVGDLGDYRRWKGPVVSATKTVWRERGNGSSLVSEFPDQLVINWVDGPKHLYEWTGAKTFTRINDFIARNKHDGVLVHCDQGLSRSPTACMVYMAKRGGLSTDFDKAVDEFQQVFYPQWSPGGILDFVCQHWKEIS